MLGDCGFADDLATENVTAFVGLLDRRRALERLLPGGEPRCLTKCGTRVLRLAHNQKETRFQRLVSLIERASDAFAFRVAKRRSRLVMGHFNCQRFDVETARNFKVCPHRW